MPLPSLWPKPRIRRLAKLKSQDAKFLAGGKSRVYEFFRVIRIALEFIRGFRALHFVGPCITVFGSARFKEDHPYYQLTRRVGNAISKEGYTVITGGGPGLMEAANRGARDGGGRSVGCNVVLPHEQGMNAYCDEGVTFYYFFVRKVMLLKYSHAFVFMPGGFGTLDEMTESLTLIQTGKLYDFPVILMGTDYWKGYLDWIKNTLIPNGTISADDLDYITCTDDPEEVARIIRANGQRLGYHKAIPPV